MKIRTIRKGSRRLDGRKFSYLKHEKSHIYWNQMNLSSFEAERKHFFSRGDRRTTKRELSSSRHDEEEDLLPFWGRRFQWVMMNTKFEYIFVKKEEEETEELNDGKWTNKFLPMKKPSRCSNEYILRRKKKFILESNTKSLWRSIENIFLDKTWICCTNLIIKRNIHPPCFWERFAWDKNLLWRAFFQSSNLSTGKKAFLPFSLDSIKL